MMGSLSMPTAEAPARTWSTALLGEIGPGLEPTLEAARQRAALTLARHPFPSRREEAWRFTDIAPLQAITPALLAPGTTDPATLPAAAAASRPATEHLNCYACRLRMEKTLHRFL